MPQTCVVDSRGASGAPDTAWSEAEIVIAITLLSSLFRVPRTLRSMNRYAACGGYSALCTVWVPALRSSAARRVRDAKLHHQTYPATSLMRAIISSTAFSTGTFSLTTRFIAFAHTFSLLRIVNL